MTSIDQDIVREQSGCWTALCQPLQLPRPVSTAPGLRLGTNWPGLVKAGRTSATDTAKHGPRPPTPTSGKFLTTHSRRSGP